MASVSEGNRLAWIALAVAMVAATFAYLPAIRAPFLFDDSHAIANNASIRRLWPLTALHPPGDTPVAGRPIPNLTLAVTYRLNEWLAGGTAAAASAPTPGFHVGNILLHLLAGALLFGIVRRTAERPTAREWLAAGAITPAGFAGAVAALWLLHPIQTEAVNYLTQRTELVVAVCYLATLYGSIRAWSAATSRRRLCWSAFAVVACLLGMGSKEVMVTAPLMVVLYDRAFHFDRWGEIRARAPFYAALALTAVWLAVIVAGNPRAGTAGFGLGISWYGYLYTQAWAIARYLQMTFIPSGFVLDYGTRPVTGWVGLPGLLLLTSLLVATIIAWTRLSRWAALALLGAWFFLILAPSSSIVPVVTEIAAERRFYLPLASVIVVALVGAEWLRRRLLGGGGWRDPARWRIGFVGIAAVVLTGATFRRSGMYRDPELLWRESAARFPDNPRAWESRAIALFAKDPTQRAEVTANFQRAIALDSTFSTAWLNLAELARTEGRLADASDLMERALRADSTDPSAYARFGVLLLDLGRSADAIDALERAAARTSNDQIEADLGRAYVVAGRMDDAIAAFDRALRLNPGRLDLALFVGRMLVDAGRGDDAVPFLDRVASQRDLSGYAWAQLAVAYAGANRLVEGGRYARRAAELANGDARTLLYAGRAMFLARRGREANDYLTEAARLAPNDAETLTALAAVRAALGDVKVAADLYERALKAQPGYAPALRGLTTLRGRA